MKGFTTACMLLGLSLTGCEKEGVSRFSGNYSGIFIYSDPTNLVTTSPGAPASITFNKNQYTSTGNQNRIPAGGSGNFEVLSSTAVKFADENVWTADFDWRLILSGEYTYKAQGDSLFLAKYIGGLKVFEYRLERIL